jgi:glycosyltransferase involved in cell wall biosynthesis
MSAPLVSVLIAARNAGPWLGQTLDSVLAQRWPVVETVVAEAGSTDDTRQVAERYRAHGVRLLPAGPTASAPANRNRALAAATGGLIFYLDADDVIDPDALSRLVEAIDADPEAVAIGEWGRFYARPEDAVFPPPPDWDVLPGVEWLIRDWTGGQPMSPIGTFLIPRDVAQRAGPWDERAFHLADFEYFTRVALTARSVRFAPGARLRYRSGIGSTLSARRTPAAWRSAWMSLDIGTRALLERAPGDRACRAVADVFQELAFSAYLEDHATFTLAEQRTRELGGSSVVMNGGVLFRAVRGTFGWKAAKRVKRFFYQLGYGQVAAFKEAVLAGDRPR